MWQESLSFEWQNLLNESTKVSINPKERAKQLRLAKKMEDNNNSFTVEIDNSLSSLKIWVKDDILILWTKKISDFDQNTKSLKITKYYDDWKGNIMSEILIKKKDDTFQKVWMDSLGQIMFHEPVNGVMQVGDILRRLWQ